MSEVQETLKREVQGRMAASAEQRKKTRAAVSRGERIAADPDQTRAYRYQQRMRARQTAPPGGGAPKTASAPADAVPAIVLGGGERVHGDSADFIDTRFLADGMRAARAVGCLRGKGDRGLGTGFLVAPGLLLTNQHVLLDEAAAASAEIEFDYETVSFGPSRTPTRFRLDPAQCFVSSRYDDLDFALVAVGAHVRGAAKIEELGYLPLSGRDDKHALGIPVNIVQHPNVRPKQVVLRNNLLVARGERTLLYDTDTSDGSSGSPVFNDLWEVIALHHWAEPFLDQANGDGLKVPEAVNEGVRISLIVERLGKLAPTLGAPHRQAVERVLAAAADPATVPWGQAGVSSVSGPVAPAPTTGGRVADAAVAPAGEAARAREPRLSAEPGSVTVPFEVTVRLGGGRAAGVVARRRDLEQRGDEDSAGPEAPRLDPDYTNRRGYRERFLKVEVPLPRFGPKLAPLVAPLEDDQPDAASGRLDYQNFSVVVNAERRLAFFSAVNIDGRSYLPFDRKTGLPLTEGPEGESWYTDTRIDPAHTIRGGWYGDHSNRFDRGHLTRRNDATWGNLERARRAHWDTFHWTNCSPQHWLFNESSEWWQGIERHYLEFGLLKGATDRKRITVLSGPVFDDKDPDIGGVKVPLRFWKIVARVAGGELLATGFVASQASLLKRLRGKVARPDEDDEPTVDEFLCSVKTLQKLTRLDFGPLLAADTFKRVGVPDPAEAPEMQLIRSWADLPL